MFLPKLKVLASLFLFVLPFFFVIIFWSIDSRFLVLMLSLSIVIGIGLWPISHVYKKFINLFNDIQIYTDSSLKNQLQKYNDDFKSYGFKISVICGVLFFVMRSIYGILEAYGLTPTSPYAFYPTISIRVAVEALFSSLYFEIGLIVSLCLIIVYYVSKIAQLNFTSVEAYEKLGKNTEWIVFLVTVGPVLSILTRESIITLEKLYIGPPTFIHFLVFSFAFIIIFITFFIPVYNSYAAFKRYKSKIILELSQNIKEKRRLFFNLMKEVEVKRRNLNRMLYLILIYCDISLTISRLNEVKELNLTFTSLKFSVKALGLTESLPIVLSLFTYFSRF